MLPLTIIINKCIQNQPLTHKKKKRGSTHLRFDKIFINTKQRHKVRKYICIILTQYLFVYIVFLMKREL